MNDRGPIFEKHFKPEKKPPQHKVDPAFLPSKDISPAQLAQLKAQGWDPDVAAALQAEREPQRRAQARREAEEAEEALRADFLAARRAEGFTDEVAQAQLDEALERRQAQRDHLDRMARSMGSPHTVQPRSPWELMEAASAAVDPLEELRAEVDGLKAKLAELTGEAQ